MRGHARVWHSRWRVGGILLALALGSLASCAAVALDPAHQCGFCHGLHSNPTPGLLRNASIEALCLSCHGLWTGSAPPANDHVSQGCMVCHDPHDGQENIFGPHGSLPGGPTGQATGFNIKMLRAWVEPRGQGGLRRPVVFESRVSSDTYRDPYSYCDLDADGDGDWVTVCDTCHGGASPSPIYHRRDAPGGGHHAGLVSQGNDRCTTNSCHPHKFGFTYNLENQ